MDDALPLSVCLFNLLYVCVWVYMCIMEVGVCDCECLGVCVVDMGVWYVWGTLGLESVSTGMHTTVHIETRGKPPRGGSCLLPCRGRLCWFCCCTEPSGLLGPQDFLGHFLVSASPCLRRAGISDECCCSWLLTWSWA